MEIYLRTGEWMWRCDAEYKQSECMEIFRGGNGGEKDFQRTEGEGPGFLCGAS